MNPRDTMLSKVRDYLADRRQAGFALTIAGKQLQSFAHFADRSGPTGSVPPRQFRRKFPREGFPVLVRRVVSGISFEGDRGRHNRRA